MAPGTARSCVAAASPGSASFGGALAAAPMAGGGHNMAATRSFDCPALAAMLSHMRAALAILLLLGPTALPAAVTYMWVDENNERHWSDTPHPGAQQVELTPQNANSGAAAAAAAGARRIRAAGHERGAGLHQLRDLAARERSGLLRDRLADDQRATRAGPPRRRCRHSDGRWRRHRAHQPRWHGVPAGFGRSRLARRGERGARCLRPHDFVRQRR